MGRREAAPSTLGSNLIGGHAQVAHYGPSRCRRSSPEEISCLDVISDPDQFYGRPAKLHSGTSAHGQSGFLTADIGECQESAAAVIERPNPIRRTQSHRPLD